MYTTLTNPGDTSILAVVSHLIYSLSTASYTHPNTPLHKIISTWPTTSGRADYPTSFTRDINPLPLHSHNDEWRKVPFYSALEVGCISVEADVWLYHDELYIGHDISSLTPNRTFASLYIDPIVDVLTRQNPTTGFINGTETRNGVFDVDVGQTLYLWIDIKTGDEVTWPVVSDHLAPLRDRGWLTYYDGVKDKIEPGPVTVIATGDSKWETLMANKTYRDYFIDAPLELLGTDKEQLHPDTGLPLYDNTTSIVASTPFGKYVGKVFGGVNRRQKETIRRHVKAATERGLMARYWDTPYFPRARMEGVWKVLMDEGVGLLNVDDLKGAAFGKW